MTTETDWLSQEEVEVAVKIGYILLDKASGEVAESGEGSSVVKAEYCLDI